MPRLPLTQEIAQADAKAKEMERNPKINPSGKGRYYGAVNVLSGEQKVKPHPDPSHAARLRGAAARNRARSWDTIVQEPKK